MIRALHQPLISIQIDHRQEVFEPGEVLSGAFQIDAVEADEVRAVEVSVLWFTEGTGEEDLAVHYFERLDRRPDAGTEFEPVEKVPNHFAKHAAKLRRRLGKNLLVRAGASVFG